MNVRTSESLAWITVDLLFVTVGLEGTGKVRTGKVSRQC